MIPLARATDPVTSHIAAALIGMKRREIQAAVFQAFAEHGPMSARRAERLPEFTGRYGFSTVRKRVCELHDMGALVPTGEVDVSERAPSLIFRVAGVGDPPVDLSDPKPTPRPTRRAPSMQVTITIDHFTPAINAALAGLLAAVQDNSAAVTTDTPTPAKARKAKVEPTQTAPAIDAPPAPIQTAAPQAAPVAQTPAPAAATPATAPAGSPTLADVKGALRAFADVRGLPAVRELLKTAAGVEKLSDAPPTTYPAIIAAAKV